MSLQPRSPLDGQWIEERLKALATFTDEPGQMTRLTLSPAHRAAVDELTRWFGEAGLTTRLDAMGTLIGRYEGQAAGARRLLIGSHIDTVKNAGIYDGNLGVILGLALIAHLNAKGRRLPFAIELVAFGDEEGVRFPTAMTGSRALAGRFDPACLDERDASGVSRRSALAEFGAAGATAGASEAGAVIGYVEAHIEQGPVLEAAQLALGIVTGISGASRGEIRVEGVCGHAGTLPMAMRRDALAGAAQMILAIEARANAEPGLVATVGRIDVANGAVNVVPGACRFSLDLRAPDDALRLSALDDIKAEIARIAARRELKAVIDIAYDAPAAPCDPKLCEALAQAMRRCGHADFRLPSGAGHDAMSFRGVLPMAMLFVRCRSGISHNPAEYAAPEDMGAAAHVLLEFIDALTKQA